MRTGSVPLVGCDVVLGYETGSSVGWDIELRVGTVPSVELDPLPGRSVPSVDESRIVPGFRDGTVTGSGPSVMEIFPPLDSSSSPSNLAIMSVLQKSLELQQSIEKMPVVWLQIRILIAAYKQRQRLTTWPLFGSRATSDVHQSLMHELVPLTQSEQ